jgi:hypothetical protein
MAGWLVSFLNENIYNRNNGYNGHVWTSEYRFQYGKPDQPVGLGRSQAEQAGTNLEHGVGRPRRGRCHGLVEKGRPQNDEFMWVVDPQRVAWIFQPRSGPGDPGYRCSVRCLMNILLCYNVVSLSSLIGAKILRLTDCIASHSSFGWYNVIRDIV